MLYRGDSIYSPVVGFMLMLLNPRSELLTRIWNILLFEKFHVVKGPLFLNILY